MTKLLHVENKDPKVLIIGLITPKNNMVEIESYFNEFENLVESNNIKPDLKYFSKLRSIDTAFFLTKGKLEEVKKICIESEVDEIIISESISPNQETTLEKYLNVDVYDRTHLILEIFEKRASSAEAKLQIKIAFLEHKKTRLTGKGKYLSQQSGRIGAKGPGETQKEIDIQHINHLLVKLKKDLKNLEKIRLTQRKKRIVNKIPQIAIIGYTNAGKSTFFNSLVKEDVLAEDKLFATLDTTTRRLYLDEKKTVLVSDTVGFIQNLPHKLIDAFKSTLEELKYADLLIHMVDISDKNYLFHIDTVNNVLKELNCEKKKTIIFLNKIDLLSKEELKERSSKIKGKKIKTTMTDIYEIEKLKKVIKKEVSSI